MTKVVSLGSTKEAALYFDEVMPLDGLQSARSEGGFSSSDLSESIPYENGELSEKIVSSLLSTSDPAEMLSSLLSLQWGVIFCETASCRNVTETDIAFTKAFSELHGIEIKIDDFISGPAKQKTGEALANYLKRLGYQSCPTWSQEPLIQLPLQGQSDSRFETTLSNLKLVDNRKLSWNEVIEFRKDSESSKSLRDLRIFFFDNFDGKPSSYIEDKLLSLLDKQEATARLWGFETVQKSLSVAFSNHSAIVSSMAGLAAAVSGVPLAVAAGAALVVPFGNTVLEFSKILIDSKRQKIDRPTQFLTSIKSLQGKH